MATRIVHLSDLHFPAKDAAQPDALLRSIGEAAPDIVVTTGDLTRRGRRSEFQAAADFLQALPGHKLVVPGNHDVPLSMLERMNAPFGRFSLHFGGLEPCEETPDVLVVGLNTAYGIRAAYDWSLGRASAGGVEGVVERLKRKHAGQLALVASHHPLQRTDLDSRRSRTSGGAQAFETLALAGMDILLHGHLHRAMSRCRRIADREVCEIGSTTALSDRERDGTSGYNILDIASGVWRLSVVRWQDGRYGEPEAVEPAALP